MGEVAETDAQAAAARTAVVGAEKGAGVEKGASAEACAAERVAAGSGKGAVAGPAAAPDAGAVPAATPVLVPPASSPEQGPASAETASIQVLAASVPAATAPAVSVQAPAPSSAHAHAPAATASADPVQAPAPAVAAPGLGPTAPALETLDAFRTRVYALGRALYRDLPWRRTRDPYAIWVSEAMLQQTQVARVDGRWQSWLERFPTPDALATASSADVLEEWQGLGYNRRALALWRAAQAIASEHGGLVPQDERALLALPGIGPATVSGIRAFAFDLPGVYLETNVRTVFLHERFPDAEGVPDSALVPLVREACPPETLRVAGVDEPLTPRSWYYALLDYGAHLKRTLPNPSRRSRSHVRQSRFEGSHRQKRAFVVRLLLDARAAGARGLNVDEVCACLCEAEVAAGRAPVQSSYVADLLNELLAEGFCHEHAGHWYA